MAEVQPIADFGLPISDSNRVANPPSGSVDRTDQKKQQVAKDFESVLLTKVFDQVQQSMGHWDLEEEGTSQQVQGLFWFYLARDAGDKGGFGLWKDIYQHLRQMEGAPNPVESMDEEL
jgi:hypothetical protein